MAQYGAGSKEDHRKSGYNLPDSFYMESTPDGSGEASPEEVAAAEGQKAEKATIENKAAVAPKARKRSKK